MAFIARRAARSARRRGYADAIITGTRGTGEAKVAALIGASATVVDVPSRFGAGQPPLRPYLISRANLASMSTPPGV